LSEIREQGLIGLVKPAVPGMPVKPAVLRAGRFVFPLGRRTYIMGILNVTPDSFSDGGQFFTVDHALRRAEEMLKDGADILDIGGESSRPGGTPISAGEELQRVMPILERVVSTFDCPVSIDTAKSQVARAALAAGACMLNDINGLQLEPGLATAAQEHQAAVVIMHNARLYRKSDSPDVPISSLAADMRRFLSDSCQIAVQAGLCAEQMIIDPGVGFGVTPEESIQMINDLAALADFNLPILLGPSRKRFIGYILDLPADERIHGTSAAVAIGIANGADLVRVHDVRAMVEVSRVADAICRRRAGWEGTT
jgi:dihydropteroate synthase